MHLLGVKLKWNFLNFEMSDVCHFGMVAFHIFHIGNSFAVEFC